MLLLWFVIDTEVQQSFIKYTFEAQPNNKFIFRDIGFSDFIHRPGIKKQTKEKHDVSETGSVSVLR
jgi:hypothetical protein